MVQILRDFKTNLYAGLRLALFWPCESGRFRFNLDQIVLLVFLDLIFSNIADYVQVLPNPGFDIYALPIYSFDLFSFFALAYLLGKAFKRNDFVLQLGVLVYSFAPLLTVLNFLSFFPDKHPDTVFAKWMLWPKVVISIYMISVFYRALSLACGRNRRQSVFALLLFIMLSSTSYNYYQDNKDFWYRDKDRRDSEQQDPYAAYRALDAETLMYRQTALLENSLAELNTLHKRKADLFFVGFAGYATEDVFSKEVFYAQELFDERFDTRGHSISLINHLQTLDKIPLATATNLALTLKRIGKIMNTEEDILFLYLTSHGSENHQLSVSFWPLALNNITPQNLNAMLDDAGIKWRIVIVSSCYSGGFITALQGPATLVATASAADKTSFGCGNESDFTYFGEALFKEQLQQQTSFVTALQAAAISIKEREIRENISASDPQLSVGADMNNKLKQLDRQIKQQQCTFDKQQAKNC